MKRPSLITALLLVQSLALIGALSLTSRHGLFLALTHRSLAVNTSAFQPSSNLSLTLPAAGFAVDTTSQSDLKLDTGGTPIQTIALSIAYDPDYIVPVAFDADISACAVITESRIDTQKNQLHFDCLLNSTSKSVQVVRLGSIRYRGLKAGTSWFKFQEVVAEAKREGGSYRFNPASSNRYFRILP